MGEDRAMGNAAPKDNSMEEILASIRRIISSDSEEGAAAQMPPEPAKGKPVQPDAENKVAAGAADTPPASSREGHTSAQAPTQPVAGKEPGSDTFAGLAEQLRGTKDHVSVSGTSQPETADQSETIETRAVGAAVDEKKDSKAPDTRSDASSDSGARSLADLAKSINKKIDAVAMKDAGKAAASEETPQGDGSKEAQGREQGLENTGPNPASAGSLSELAKSLQARAEGTAAQPATPKVNAEEASNSDVSGTKSQASETSPPQAAIATTTNTSVACGQETADPDQSDSDGQKAAMLASNLSQKGGDRPEEFREALVSPSTQQAVSGSMDRLKQAASGLDQARVEAVLRPLLREWLDNNLPGLVERMVQQEIDRIVDDAGAAGVDQSPQPAPQQAKSA